MSSNRNFDPATPFTLWCNNRLYLIPTKTITEVSVKASALVQAGQFTGSIPGRVLEATASAFVSACSLQDVVITPPSAFELLDLATSWEIPTLISRVKSFIQSEAVHKETIPDYLGDLVRHIKDDEDVTEDIENVSLHLNSYFKDERLTEVRPEALFKVCLSAKLRGLNEDSFADFVFRLFELDPQKAVALCLLLDFDRLTEAQRDEVFQCREIHELSLGYFLASAVSADRNRAAQQIDLLDEKFDRLFKQVKNVAKQQHGGDVKDLEAHYNAEIAALKKQLEDQQRQIAELKALKESQQDMIDAESASFDRQLKELQQELDRQAALAKVKQAEIAEKRAVIQEEVDRQVESLRADIGDKLGDVDADCEKEVKNLADETADAIGGLRNETDKMKEEQERLSAGYDEIQKGIREWRAVFAAKCVRDEFRFDHYIRELGKRFSLFDAEIQIWGLTGELVASGSEFVGDLEKQIDEVCPRRRLVKKLKKKGSDGIE
jgi:hypothetical protein